MKQKNMVLLALALGCGLVAAFLTAKLGAGSKSDMVQILVAAKNLDQGTKLEKPEELFVRKPFPKESVPPEFIDDPAQLKDKILQRSVRAGSHCTLSDISDKDGIALPIDDATGIMYKAMGLRVNAETMVGGLVRPGAHVDVVSVERVQAQGQSTAKTVSTLILQNVLVVGVDQVTQPPEGQTYVKNAQTVTLAVKQQEGMLLAMAQKRGDVFLMLRSREDTKITKNRKLEDYGRGDRDSEFAGAEEGTAPTSPIKIPVARKAIPAGTKIENPADYFQETEWPAATVKANFVTKMADLKGKTVAKDVPPNLPVTSDALKIDGGKPAATVAAEPVDDSERHTIAFQVGGAAPYYAHFRDGRLEGPAPAAKSEAPVAASTVPATPAKPEK